MALTPLAGYLGEYFSWRIGLLILGTIIFVVGIVISQTLMRKPQPEAYGMLPDGDKTPLPHQVPSIPTFTKVSTIAFIFTPLFAVSATAVLPLFYRFLP